MRAFAALLEALDHTTSTNERVAAIAVYLRSAPPASAAFAVAFLAGRRIPRALPRAVLREVVLALTRTPEWLFERCLESVGDAAETCVLLLDRVPPAPAADRGLDLWVRDIKILAKLPVVEQRDLLSRWLTGLASPERLALTKLLFGELRVGVSSTLVVRAVAEAKGVTAEVVAANLVDFDPFVGTFDDLLRDESGSPRPYPFQLSAPIEDAVDLIGPRGDFQAEWKWDGIRAQALVDGGRALLWSRGEEVITDKFPEVVEDLLSFVPSGTTLDGEILAFADGKPRPFTDLQTRLGRKTVSARLRADVPCVYLAYDVLRADGADVRARPLGERRALLEVLFAGRPEGLSSIVPGDDFAALAAERSTSRERGVEGLMLKRLSSPYAGGRHRGPSWKWKVEPDTIDAVLTYAQPGSGRRANLLTDYTFGVWDGDSLVTVAKAYSGLGDAEILELDGFLRAHTLERFGPVRSIEPAQVFELAFDAIGPSKRHKSGVALRFPRIARWRKDKLPRQADTLAHVQRLAQAKSSFRAGGAAPLSWDRGQARAGRALRHQPRGQRRPWPRRALAPPLLRAAS